MKRISILLFMSTVMFMLSFICVSAQQIDVDHMNNEQLTTLLLQILDKLQLEETQAADTASEAKSSETPVPTAAPAPVIETEPETMTFSVYGNKKLTVEALPGYMFIQKPSGSGDDSEPEMQWSSLEECDIFCMHQCQGWNPKGYMETNKGCYDSCLMENCTAWGDPIPDWAK